MLSEVLVARERRWTYRLALAEETGNNVISITLCAPVRYRCTEDAAKIVDLAMNELISAFKSGGIEAYPAGTMDGADGAAGFAVAMGDVRRIKRICVQIETFPGGRLLDIDVMDGKGRPISREDINMPPRRCFVCNEQASWCVRSKAHSDAEINEAIEGLIRKWARLMDTVSER